MKRKFFLKRFVLYFLAFFIPTAFLFGVAFTIFEKNAEDKLLSQEQKIIEATDANLSLVISNIVMQNELFTKNPYMGIALKNILKKSDYISYSDTIYLRSMKAMLRSITEVHSYVSNVNIYLCDYDRYYSSEKNIQQITGDEYWIEQCKKMNKDQNTLISRHDFEEYNEKKSEMTIYQRMLLMDGFVVMNIDFLSFENMMEQTVGNNDMIVLFSNTDGEYIYGYQNYFEDHSEVIRQLQSRNGKEEWITLQGKEYLTSTVTDEKFNLQLYGLVSKEVVYQQLQTIYPIYFSVFFINTLIVTILAYFITKRNFLHLEDLIQIFSNAEKDIYQPLDSFKQERDEYDVIMKNIVYLFLQKVKVDKELKEKDEKEKIAQITALQAQINPHFLFNTLQTIQLEIRKIEGKNSTIANTTEQLGEILKYALGDVYQQVTLTEEIQYLKKYIEIQKLRFGEKFIVYYEIDEDLYHFRVFRLLLQPIVENSILHGVRFREKGYIKIKIFKSRKSGNVKVSVIDLGVGMSKEELNRLREKINTYDSNHVGLANVNCRLKLYYGENASLKLYSKKEYGTVVTFELPIQ